MVVFMLGMLLLNFNYIFSSKIKTIIFMAISTLTFENLPLIIIVILLRSAIEKREKIRLVVIAITTSIITYILFLLGILFVDEFSISNATDGRYFEENIDKFFKISSSIILFLGFAFALGTLVSNFLSKSFKEDISNSPTKAGQTHILISVSYGYFASMIFGFFVSGLWEFGRQLMPLQVMFFLLGFLRPLHLEKCISKFRFQI